MPCWPCWWKRHGNSRPQRNSCSPYTSCLGNWDLKVLLVLCVSFGDYLSVLASRIMQEYKYRRLVLSSSRAVAVRLLVISLNREDVSRRKLFGFNI